MLLGKGMKSVLESIKGYAWSSYRASKLHCSYLYSALTYNKLISVIVFIGFIAYASLYYYEFNYIGHLFARSYSYTQVFSEIEDLQSTAPLEGQVSSLKPMFHEEPQICYDPSERLVQSLSYSALASIQVSLLGLGQSLFNSAITKAAIFGFKRRMIESWLFKENGQLALNIINPSIAYEARSIVNDISENYIDSLISSFFIIPEVLQIGKKIYNLNNLSSTLIKTGLNFNVFNFFLISTSSYLCLNTLVTYFQKRIAKTHNDLNYKYEQNLAFNALNPLQVEASKSRIMQFYELNSMLRSNAILEGQSVITTMASTITNLCYNSLTPMLFALISVSALSINPKLFFEITPATNLMAQISAGFWQLSSHISQSVNLGNYFKKIVNFHESIEEYGNLVRANKDLKLIYKEEGVVKVDNLTIYKPRTTEERMAKVKSGTLISKLSYEFKSGEITGVIGRSGCGKSCFFNVLFGINPFARGVVETCRKEDIIYIPQTTIFKPRTTLRDILYSANDATLSKIPNNKIQALQDHIKNWAHILEISHIISNSMTSDDWGNTLSGGEKQRLAILRALVEIYIKRALNHKSTILLMLDESLGALDPYNRRSAFELLKTQVKRYKVTAIHIDHSEPAVIRERYTNDNVIDFDKLRSQTQIHMSTRG
jgi:ABC-type uncharacterized transport system fused permease/ATPase subunit